MEKKTCCQAKSFEEKRIISVTKERGEESSSTDDVKPWTTNMSAPLICSYGTISHFYSGAPPHHYYYIL